MEGPRAVRKEELESLRSLTDIVFRQGLMDEYPQLFNEDNLENLRVIVDNGKCVSHVGMIQRHASLFGCIVKVCCIGAVSTLPEYRNRGLASACFDDAIRKATNDGVDIMLVSGDRNLYRMRGCLRVGCDAHFTLKASDLLSLESYLSQQEPAITVEPMRKDELALVMECYRHEPVRFLRPLEDYLYALQCGVVMDRPSDFLVIRQNGEFRGYVIVQHPREDGKAMLAEFAGDRHALLAALPLIAKRYDLQELHWQVLRHDVLFRSLCEQAGLKPAPAYAHYTLKLVNFPQLMERMRLRWEELLGWRDASKLSFWQKGEQYGFRFGDDELVTDRDTATRLIFGTVSGEEAQKLEGHGKLTDVLKVIFPLPCLWYGVNYV